MLAGLAAAHCTLSKKQPKKAKKHLPHRRPLSPYCVLLHSKKTGAKIRYLLFIALLYKLRTLPLPLVVVKVWFGVCIILQLRYIGTRATKIYSVTLIFSPNIVHVFKLNHFKVVTNRKPLVNTAMCSNDYRWTDE